MTVHVAVLREVTDEVVEAFRRLTPQLRPGADPPDHEALGRIVGSPASTLLIAKSGDEIAGTLTLVMFPIPTGFRAWIEDVIVDQAARGQGIGEILTIEALNLAKAAGARTVDLTSRPSREAAGRLYERVGFVPREHPALPVHLRPRPGQLTRARGQAPPHLPPPGWTAPDRSGALAEGRGHPASSATAASSRSTSDRSL